MTDPKASPKDLEQVEKLRKAYASMKEEMRKVIVGQDQVVDELFMALFCRGHCLLIGVPGLAKTLMISTLSRVLSLSFNRIQFTPDLMPSDITGTEVIQEDRASGRREFKFMPGPVFANVVLADEINRTPPKTQAALLEALQAIVRRVPIADQVMEYALKLTRMTRLTSKDAPAWIKEHLAWGAGPRASQNLVLGDKARALLAGRFYVSAEDIRAMAHPVL